MNRKKTNTFNQFNILISKKQFIFVFIFLGFINSPVFAQITFQGCTVNALGAQDFLLTLTGTTNDAGTIRNTYESIPSDFTQSCPAGVCEIRMIWNIIAGRWELQLDNDGPVGTPDYTTATLYFNTQASEPNPPDLSLGIWEDALGGTCPTAQIVTLTGDVQNTLPVELLHFDIE